MEGAKKELKEKPLTSIKFPRPYRTHINTAIYLFAYT